MFFPGDCVNKQKLSLQKELDKACTENTELQAEELVLMEVIFCLYKECHTFFSCELCLPKQLGFLSEKEKDMFVRKLAFIEDLERSKQGACGGIGPPDVVEAFESTANSFDGLFDLFSPSVLASFVDISQSFRPSLG